VIDRVRELGGPVIRGNHDKSACAEDGMDDFNPAARQAMEWTRAQLRPESRRYLQELPAGPMEAGGLTLVHGALHDEDEYVFSPVQALASLLTAPSEVTFFGHTHFQGGFSYREERIDLIQLRPRPGANFAALRLEPGTRYLLNPGSIGQPRDGDPRAAFAIADLGHRVVEFWRVPYDIQAVQERMASAGAPEPLISRLSLGR
jgi:diadenosine tetraphosphatase ApaH/serine/threonine PP2A family protein phosphatase